MITLSWWRFSLHFVSKPNDRNEVKLLETFSTFLSLEILASRKIEAETVNISVPNGRLTPQLFILFFRNQVSAWKTTTFQRFIASRAICLFRRPRTCKLISATTQSLMCRLQWVLLLREIKSTGDMRIMMPSSRWTWNLLLPGEVTNTWNLWKQSTKCCQGQTPKIRCGNKMGVTSTNWILWS